MLEKQTIRVRVDGVDQYSTALLRVKTMPLLQTLKEVVKNKLFEEQVAISGNIKGMFHQVRLLPKFRPLLQFLWPNLKP